MATSSRLLHLCSHSCHARQPFVAAAAALRGATTTTTLSLQQLSSSSNRSGALGSSLGTDSSMIAANNRCNIHTTTLGHRDLPPPEDSVKTFSRHGPTMAHHYPPASQLRFFSSRSIPTTTTNPTTKNDCKTRRFFSTTTNNAGNSNSTSMQDEYGEMTSDGTTYVHPTPFVLESGVALPEAQLRYQTYGQLNDQRDNVLVICHALTGNASLHAWWGDLLGPGKAFDTDKYLVVCSNILGSCYGSTNPMSIDPTTGSIYGKDFPDVSVQDTVKLQLHMLTQELKVNSIKSVIGGSFGGMQAVEFAVQAGGAVTSPFADQSFFAPSDNKIPLVRTVIPIACGAAHTAWQIAISETQRQAIYADPHWDTDNAVQATAGLAVARQIGMVSYRTAKGYVSKFGRDIQPSEQQQKLPYGSSAHWKVKSYLEYQGTKFLDRFDPITYVKMTEQMDSHDISRGRHGTIQDVLRHVHIPALVLGIDSDVLYPLEEQQALADALPQGELHVIHSDDGHDGFLLEQEQVAKHIATFLDQRD